MRRKEFTPLTGGWCGETLCLLCRLGDREAVCYVEERLYGVKGRGDRDGTLE
jgi:hypothetical protein